MKIVIDVYGCDNPDRVIKGCVKAIREIDDVCLILVGKENEIIEKIKNEDFDKKRIEIINADEVITNNESPSVAIRQKRNSSLRVAYKTLKENDECLAMITCGSTGAVIIGSIMCLGKEEGVERPALATLLPCTNGKFSCLVDCGANVDTKPNQLVQFAKSATKYMQRSFRINNPSVALLSVGTEDAKGNILTKETFTLLKESNMNFVGNMEAKTVLSGDVNIIVSDGFAGNVLLKSIEGVSKSVMSTFVSLLYTFRYFYYLWQYN